MVKVNARSICISIAVVVCSTGTCWGQKKNQALIDSIADYLCKSPIVHKEIVMRQAILESGWFASDFLMSRNNLFGFRYKEYLRFGSWQKSIDYYAQWQQKRYKDMNEDYYVFLKRIRYGSASYPDAVKRISYTLKCPCTE